MPSNLTTVWRPIRRQCGKCDLRICHGVADLDATVPSNLTTVSSESTRVSMPLFHYGHHYDRRYDRRYRSHYRVPYDRRYDSRYRYHYENSFASLRGVQAPKNDTPHSTVRGVVLLLAECARGVDR